MLANGRSLSGRERNCCFLNTRSGKFADISAVSGFDFPDDTRGVTVTDWDQDGDLDIWLTNRTAPRVRFLRNNYSSGLNSVLLKLQGVKSNRDGIGSRVELDLGSGRRKLVRTLRAGEGYLGQSSKWLHFGLGAATDVAGYFEIENLFVGEYDLEARFLGYRAATQRGVVVNQDVVSTVHFSLRTCCDFVASCCRRRKTCSGV